MVVQGGNPHLTLGVRPTLENHRKSLDHHSSYLLGTPLRAVGLLRYGSYRLHVGDHVVTASHPFAADTVIVGAWRPSAHGVSPDDDSADDGSKRIGDVTA